MGMWRTMDAKLFPDWQIDAIAENLIREEDRAELTAYSGLSAGEALCEAVESEGRSWLIFDKSQGLIAVFGVHESQIVKGGVIWAVLTPDFMNCLDEFNKLSKIILDHWLDKYGVLSNYIDVRNKSHVRWLEYLGFTFEFKGIIVNQVLFQLFHKEKKEN